MTADTLTGQQQAAAVLSKILAMPGLVQATWKVYPDRLATGTAEVVGQISVGSHADVNAAIDAYALAFELSLDDERHVPGSDYCEAFTEISTSGVIDGVNVKVWGAVR